MKTSTCDASPGLGMATREHAPDRATVVELLQDYHRAMVEADTDKLAALVDRGFSLTHITGYVQPREEWFHVVRTGQFAYHQIDIDEVAVRLGTAVADLEGGGTFTATINGMHASWRLRFSLAFAYEGGRWTLMSARYRSA